MSNVDSLQLWQRVRTRLKLKWAVACVALVVVATAFVWSERRARAEASHEAATANLPVVAVAKVDRQDLYREVTIPAEFRPYVEVELHAKVSGYVDQMNVDFGDRVKAGQLLATLEVPELQDELSNSIAMVQRAQADHEDAHLLYTRLVGVNEKQPNLVAQQDLDTAEAKDRSTAAAIAADKADADKYHALLDYTRITAPFDGVITWRYADPGALIEAGTTSETQAKSLLRISDNYHLRLDFPVSVEYVRDIRLGDKVEVRVESLGGKSFTGRISRFTRKVSEDTRTMITEVEVPNPNLEIDPGMYATVVLKVEEHPRALSIPLQAAAAGGSTHVLVVNANREIEERSVTLGLETPSQYEVVSGLQEGDLVMLGNPEQLKPGQKVAPKILPPLAME
ncbi:MAG TPA: efflux RND transporter periplasmic adaptor subunit [Verrucomicrobiae bacterium]|nr:efflux RND transporter periplasmic adaptor subunit [Verrucomicrobiae bacterium]